jgi:predicted oxidoreductase
MKQKNTINVPGDSPIALGLWRLNDWGIRGNQLTTWIEEALDLGFTTFDHADIYGGYTCEEIFGEALANKPSLREKMYLISKCGIVLPTSNRPDNRMHKYDTTRRHIIASAEQSLRNLHTDYLDLLLIHRPDPLMNPHEVAEAFGELSRSGKVRHFGVSNFSSSQFNLLQAAMDVPLITNQVEISVLHLDALYDGTLDECMMRNIRPMAWSPFGGGRLFTSRNPNIEKVRNELETIADVHNGAATDQVALAWLLHHPAGIIPVLGTGNMDRLRGAKGALQLPLTHDQWFSILTAARGREVD